MWALAAAAVRACAAGLSRAELIEAKNAAAAQTFNTVAMAACDVW